MGQWQAKLVEQVPQVNNCVAEDPATLTTRNPLSPLPPCTIFPLQSLENSSKIGIHTFPGQTLCAKNMQQ